MFAQRVTPSACSETGPPAFSPATSFGIILERRESTPATGALRIGRETARRGLGSRACPAVENAGPFPMTTSAGFSVSAKQRPIAFYPATQPSHAAVRLADRAMYRAKPARRQVCCKCTPNRQTKEYFRTAPLFPRVCLTTRAAACFSTMFCAVALASRPCRRSECSWMIERPAALESAACRGLSTRLVCRAGEDCGLRISS